MGVLRKQKRPVKAAKAAKPAIRNPHRTRGRILAAAIAEFAAKGLAGARMDAIARRAGSNKRMLYHYFGDKEGLFTAVLRQKVAERRAWAADLSDDPAERLPFWFKAACQDTGWVRLLEWEALQGDAQKLINEKERRALSAEWLQQLRQRQVDGQVSAAFDPGHLALAMQSLTMYPAAFPQLARLIVGRPVNDPRFQRDYAAFLEKFATAFHPFSQSARRVTS